MFVRLKDRAKIEDGRQQLAAILTELGRAQMPNLDTKVEIQLLPAREIYAGRVRLRLLLVLAASALLLLAACASIANVFLASVASRANEFATRVALGASRGRILSQTLTEAVLLSLAGGVLGALVAKYGTLAVVAYGPEELRRLADSGDLGPLLVVALSVSLVTGVACGIVPAWNAWRPDPGATLLDAARTTLGGRRAGRMRQLLVGVEMALATLLLASAGLLMHSFVRLMGTDRGYAVERILAVDLSLFGQRYASGDGAHLVLHRASRQRARGAGRRGGGGDQQPAGKLALGRPQPDDLLRARRRLSAARAVATGRDNPERDRGLSRRERQSAPGRPLRRRRRAEPGVRDQRITRHPHVARRSVVGGCRPPTPAW